MSDTTNSPSHFLLTSLGQDPSKIGSLFGDPANQPILNYPTYNLAEVKAQIETKGYCLVKGLVPVESIEKIRHFWLDTFSTVTPAGRVTWNPYFGQSNHIGFSSDKFQHLYRACDFLWNDPFHKETRDICLRIHALRNLILDEDPFFGIRFAGGRYGIFVTASYYPGNKGHMGIHDDGVAANRKLLHSLVPITFKGRDYKEGGLMMIDRQGQTIDVDGLVQPGDVIFYDGALKHGVLPIVPYPGKDLGRIQVFPIPTVFDNLERNIRALSAIPTQQFLQAKWFKLKNQLRIRFGLNPTLR